MLSLKNLKNFFIFYIYKLALRAIFGFSYIKLRHLSFILGGLIAFLFYYVNLPLFYAAEIPNVDGTTENVSFLGKCFRWFTNFIRDVSPFVMKSSYLELEHEFKELLEQVDEDRSLLFQEISQAIRKHEKSLLEANTRMHQECSKWLYKESDPCQLNRFLQKNHYSLESQEGKIRFKDKYWIKYDLSILKGERNMNDIKDKFDKDLEELFIKKNFNFQRKECN